MRSYYVHHQFTFEFNIYVSFQMVELKSDEREQAAVLRLMTHCIHSSPQLAAQFEGLKGSSLVFRILRSPFACPGVQVVKVNRGPRVEM